MMSSSDYSDEHLQEQNGDDSFVEHDNEEEEINEASDSEVDQLNNDEEIDLDESEYRDECRVNVSHFDFLKRLGAGAYGTVFLVKKNCGTDKNKIYALKVIAKEEAVKNAKTVTHMRAERKVLELIRDCPYIPKLYYAFQTEEKLFLVLEYVPGGEMFTLLQKTPLTEERVSFYIAQLILALERIHEHNIVYRDIKLENILIDADGHIKLVDFGLCKKLGPRGRSKSLCGTVEYMAPEIVNSLGHNTAADWWAVGVLTVELLTAITPFGANTNDATDGSEIMNRITNDDPTLPPDISPEMQDFILKMLKKRPEERLGGSELSADEIKRHPVFNFIDWEKLKRKEIPAPEPPIIEHPFDTQNFSPEFTDLEPSYPPSAVPPQTFLLFKSYSYIAPELDETRPLASRKYVEETSLSWDIYFNREPDSEFDRKYRFASTQPIGKGRSSICMKCINLKNNNCYAVKVYKRQDDCSNQIDVLEKAAAQKLHGILHLVEVLRDSKWTYLIMELIDGDNLLKYLSNASITGKHVSTSFNALYKILKSVHSLKYAHRRICFKNIYHIEHSQEWRIIGFSNAKPISAEHDKYIDYWSMGVCIYTVLCGQAPFVLGCDFETVNKIEKSDFNRDSPKYRSLRKDTKKFIDQLLCSSTPTLHPQGLQCIIKEFDSVNNSKEDLDDNEHIVSIRAAKVQTQAIVENNLGTAFNGIDLNGIDINGIDINGKSSSESPPTISDVPQENHSNVQESQTNQVNGQPRRGRPNKRKGTVIIKKEPIEDDKKFEIPVTSTSGLVEIHSDSLVETNSVPVVATEPAKRERSLRIRNPPKKIHQPMPQTEQIFNIKQETNLAAQNPKNCRPKKSTKASRQTTSPKPTIVKSEDGEIKPSPRIAARKRKPSKNEEKTPKRSKKEPKQPKTKAPKQLKTNAPRKTTKSRSTSAPRLVLPPPTILTVNAISAPISRPNYSDIGVQTITVPLAYRTNESKSSHGQGYLFVRFDYK